MELEKNMQRKVGKVRIDTMMRTMPRYPSPPIIPDPGKWYKEPCIVAIGPYHHGLDHLEQAEEISMWLPTTASRNPGARSRICTAPSSLPWAQPMAATSTSIRTQVSATTTSYP